MTGTVLVTNGMLSKSLAVVRSLGERGIKVVTSDKIRWHTSGCSRFASRNLVYPDPGKRPERFLEWLERTVVAERVDVLFAMDDDTLDVVVANRARLERLVRLAVPDAEGYAVASDKRRTARLARELGVPAPETYEAGAWRDRDAVPTGMKFPLAVKPTHSSGSRGIRFVRDERELLHALDEIGADYPDPLVQERVPQGDKIDVCVLYNARRELTAAFVQKEVRNYPLERGPSTVCESIRYPELVELSDRLMKGLNWHGVADVEFMIDPRNGEPKLMEVNPRYWSSLHLSIRSGVDFPWLMYRMAMGEEVGKVTDYKTGLMGRALLPGDTLHFLSNPDRLRMNPPFWTTKLPDDTISVRDPLPTLGFFLSALRYSLDARAWRFLVRR